MNQRLSPRSERAYALVTVMVFIGTIGLVMAIEMQRQRVAGKLLDPNSGKLIDINALKQARQDLAKSLASYLNTPSMLRQSAQFPENQSYQACLYGSTVKSCSGSSNANNYKAFLLGPPNAWTFPPDKGPTTSPNKNCPKGSPGSDISCYLAGQTAGGKIVGYNKTGETGTLSSDFPFEVKVWYNPNCSGGTPDKFGNYTCSLADTITFGFQIVHHIFDKKVDLGMGPLGTYPKNPQWVTVSRSLIVGQQCNIGAEVAGIDQNGNPVCQCRFPYTANGIVDALGPQCNPPSMNCPPKSIMEGIDASGRPICSSIDSSHLSQITNSSFVLDTTTNFPGDPTDGFWCPNYGYISDVQVNCAMRQQWGDYDAQESGCALSLTNIGIDQCNYQYGCVSPPGCDATFPDSNPNAKLKGWNFDCNDVLHCDMSCFNSGVGCNKYTYWYRYHQATFANVSCNVTVTCLFSFYGSSLYLSAP